MDPSEMKALEEKTRSIVDALSSLEGETERQREMGDRLERGEAAILQLASELSTSAENLASVIELLGRSTLADDMRRLDGEINDIRAMTEQAQKDVRRAGSLYQDMTELAATVKESTRKTDEHIGRIEDALGELMKCVQDANVAAAKREEAFISRIEDLEAAVEAIDGLENTCREVRGEIEAVGKASAVRGGAIDTRLGSMESVIGRIDRNTQKGFGKERG